MEMERGILVDTEEWKFLRMRGEQKLGLKKRASMLTVSVYRCITTDRARSSANCNEY